MCTFTVKLFVKNHIFVVEHTLLMTKSRIRHKSCNSQKINNETQSFATKEYWEIVVYKEMIKKLKK